MKTKNIFLIMLIATISISKIKAQDSLIKHSVYVSPFVGFNSKMKAPVYGAEIGTSSGSTKIGDLQPEQT